MASEVEKLKKQITELEARGIDLSGRFAMARERKASSEAQHKEGLQRLAEGDQSARKELNKLGGEILERDQDCAAFAAAVATTAEKLTQAKKALVFAQDQAAIDDLEREMEHLGALDGELQTLLDGVRQKSASLLTAIDGIGQKLAARDERKWGRFGEQLRSQVRTAIWRSFENMGKAGAPRATFSQAVERDLRFAIAELRFASNGRRMPVKRGQHLYRALAQIGGLADIDSKPGDVVSLDPHDSQTLQWLREKSIELVDEQHEAVAAKEDARAAA
jgi:hypothetical protein